MILFLANGQQIRGDLVRSAVLRSDLAPVPLTLEADIRSGDASMDALLKEGQVLSTGGGDALHIVKSVRSSGRHTQGERALEGVRVTALLSACKEAGYVRRQAIIKEGASLSAIYKAAGATIKEIGADLAVARFCCPVGQVPAFQMAQVLQEEGSAVRWKGGRLVVTRLPDLFKQTPVMTLPDNASDDTDSGFLERHQVPWFFSLDANGAAVFGNRDKPRTVRYVPFKDAQRLRNMTRCLVRRKTVRIDYNSRIGAGDLVAFAGGAKLAVITVAHVFSSGSDDGGSSDTYSKLWLGELEE